jgi:hypothetical protein
MALLPLNPVLCQNFKRLGVAFEKAPSVLI